MRPLANRSSHRAWRHGFGVRAATRRSRVRCGRSGRHGLPLSDARAGSCRDRRDSRTYKSAVCLELPAVRYRGRFFRIGAYAAALRDRLCLAAARAGREAVCGARPCRGLQGHVHGGRRTRGRASRAGRGRRDHCARHGGRGTCRLANDHDAGADGGGRRRAHSGARRRWNCRRARTSGARSFSPPR